MFLCIRRNAIKDNKVISTPSIVTDSDLSQSILLPPCAPLLPTAIDCKFHFVKIKN